MFHWFTRTSRSRAATVRRRFVRPMLEGLEGRDCPSSTCTITSFTATTLSGNVVQINGTLQDDNPNACVVNLTGVVSATVQVNPDGTFAFQGPAAASGQITAVAKDTQQQLTSQQVAAQFAYSGPEIENFRFNHGALNVWIFTGTVVDAQPGVSTVTFGGPGAMQGATTTTDANGNFRLSFTLPNTPQSWTATAFATDSAQLQSDTVALICM